MGRKSKLRQQRKQSASVALQNPLTQQSLTGENNVITANLVLKTSKSTPLNWRDLIACTDSELSGFDIAALNLACAAGLPGTSQLDIQSCLRTLDSWAKQIAKATKRCQWFRQNPQKYKGSFNLFRVHVMISVLSVRFGFRYKPEMIYYNENKETFFRAEELFIHGLIEDKGGCCSSMPVLFIAVGRRLGYPLKLVRAYSHYFVRWDSPQERFNIEVSNSGGINCYTDDHYRSWPEPISPEQERDYCLLSSLSPSRELASFLFERASVWHCVADYRQAVDALIWASVLEPDNLFYNSMILKEFRKWNNYLRILMPDLQPEIRYRIPPECRYPADKVSAEVEREYVCLDLLQDLVTAPSHQEMWQRLRSAKPGSWPRGVPRTIIMKLNKSEK